MKNNTLNTKPAPSSDRDAQARAAGWKSAADMDAFYANRARMRQRGGSKIPDGKGPKPAPDAKKPADKRGVLGRLLDGLNGKSK